MKKCLLAILFIVCFSNIGFCLNVQDSLDELAYVQLRISERTIEMYPFFAGWATHDKNELRECVQDDIKGLNKIREYLLKLKVHKDVNILKDMNIALINKLHDTCCRIPNKNITWLEKDYNKFFRRQALVYIKELEIIENKYGIKKLPDTIDSTEEEINLIKDKKDRNRYLHCLKLIKRRQDKMAFVLLNKLRDKYEDTPFADCIMLRISDCLGPYVYGLTVKQRGKIDAGLFSFLVAVQEKGLENVAPIRMSESSDYHTAKIKEVALEDIGCFQIADVVMSILSDIIGNNRYSPVLYESFINWRSEYQVNLMGCSNMSPIPNDEYNEVRWQLVKFIKKYLKKRKDDTWARVQIDLLLREPNIMRGGPFGNTILNYAKERYMKKD